MADAPSTPAPATPVPDWLALTVTGADAATFLQGQLTQDLRRLAPGQPLRAALCTPQGRAIALPWLLATPGPAGDAEVVAILPGELAEQVATTLRRYVLRARARIAVATTRTVSAWAGERAAIDAALPVAAADGLAARHDDDGSWLRVGSRRALHVARPAARAVPPPGFLAATTATFEREAIHDGEPVVRAATREHWVPQMLNLDLLDALSFSKGCYTGQEIVTRTQHRGQIKRRMLRFATGSGPLPAPGDGLLSGDAKVGEVVRAAAADDGIELLAVVSLDRAAESLALGDGRTLDPRALPYALERADP